jgi:hypothetical protein
MDFIEWRSDAVNLLTVRLPAAEQDLRRQLQQLREALGATVYQDLLGKDLTALEFDRIGWEDSIHKNLANLNRKVHDPASRSAVRENIQNFKKGNKENYASLRSQELALSAFFEATNWDAHFEDFSTAKPEEPKKLREVNKKTENPELADLRAAVTALTAELDGESSTGDLTPEEHALFLKYHGHAKKLEATLPQLTLEQISEHTSWWFGGRLPKEQLKRRLLGEWRERREALKLWNIDPQINEERKKSVAPSPRSSSARSDNGRKRQYVDAWRRQREEQREQQSLKNQAADEERRREESETLMRQQEERHAVIARLKAEKELISREAEAVKVGIEERERHERTLIVRASATRINERNRAIQEKKKTLIEAKTEKLLQRQILQMTLSAKEAKKIKVQSKLFAQTHTGAFRKQTEDEQLEREKFLDRFGKRRAETFGGQVLRLQGRAVPGWRMQ